MTYMQRRPSGIYEFRKRLPQEIAGKSAPAHVREELGELINPKTGNFKQFLTISLNTTDQRAAKREDMRQAGRVADLYERALGLLKAPPVARSTRPAPELPAIQEIEDHFYRKVLEEDEQLRREGDARRHSQTPAERAAYPLLEKVSFGGMGLERSHLPVLDEEISLLLTDFRDALSRFDITIARAPLNEYLTGRGLGAIKDAAYYQDAALATLRGHLRAYQARQQRQAGEVVPTPSEPVTKSNGPKLSEAFDIWKAGSQTRGGKKPAPTTVAEAERGVRYFIQWHGDMHLGDINKEKVRDFRNAMSRLPTRLSAAQRKMPLRQLLASLEGKSLEPIHGASINKHMNLLVAIVSATERDGLMDKVAGFTNPFAKMGVTLDRRNDPNRRKPFTEADLKKLFSSRVYADSYRPLGGARDAAFWFPLIGLLSGARLNEIAQLRPEDIEQDPETGIWFFDIDTEGGRTIKTVTSRRKVPVHPELIRLGLLRYREAMLKVSGRKKPDLWPDLKAANESYRAVAWTKWFGRYLRLSAGITDRGLVFHSFRHTFKRMSRDALLPEDLSDFLTGHAGNATVGRAYGNGFGLKALAEAMRKIEAPKVVRELAEWGPISHG